jgi:apolipoprotein N-acyltransferase
LVTFGGFYFAFLVWNIVTTWWIWNSSPEGAVFAVVLNSLFMTVVFYVFHRFKNVFGTFRSFFALISFWLSFEFLHLDWDLSWPWLNLGNGLASATSLIQWYEYTGALGGTFWIWMLNILVFQALLLKSQGEEFKRKVFQALAVLLLPIGVSIIITPRNFNQGEPLNIVVVQPNIDPWGEKFGGMTVQQQLDKILNIAALNILPHTQFVFGPETALPQGVWDYEVAENIQINQIKKFTSDHGLSSFIIGLSYYEMLNINDNDKIPFQAKPYPGREDSYYLGYNSAMQIFSNEKIELYHKSKLVPGPEKFPFAKLLKPLQNKMFGSLGGMIGDMGTQDEAEVFFHPQTGYAAAPIICYESIYGEYIGDFVRKGAGFLAIITNDGWWGNTLGHIQHFEYARLRAIETRKYVVRSANTGISGVIAPDGKVLKKTSYWEDAGFSFDIYPNDNITIYSQLGDFLGRLSILTTALLLLFVIRLKILKKKAI